MAPLAQNHPDLITPPQLTIAVVGIFKSIDSNPALKKNLENCINLFAKNISNTIQIILISPENINIAQNNFSHCPDTPIAISPKYNGWAIPCQSGKRIEAHACIFINTNINNIKQSPDLLTQNLLANHIIQANPNKDTQILLDNNLNPINTQRLRTSFFVLDIYPESLDQKIIEKKLKKNIQTIANKFKNAGLKSV